MTVTISRITAPVGEVIIPTQRRKRRQRTFALRIKQTLGKQPSLELFKSQLKRTGPARLHRLGHSCSWPRCRRWRCAPHQHRKSIRRTKPKQQSLPPKEHDRKLRLAVLQREINVPRGSKAAVRDLPLHPEIRVAVSTCWRMSADQRCERSRCAAPRRQDARRGSTSTADIAGRRSSSAAQATVRTKHFQITRSDQRETQPVQTPGSAMEDRSDAAAARAPVPAERAGSPA